MQKQCFEGKLLLCKVCQKKDTWYTRVNYLKMILLFLCLHKYYIKKNGHISQSIYLYGLANLICQTPFKYFDTKDHGLLIEYGHICHIVKLPISMIRPF